MSRTGGEGKVCGSWVVISIHLVTPTIVRKHCVRVREESDGEADYVIYLLSVCLMLPRPPYFASLRFGWKVRGLKPRMWRRVFASPFYLTYYPLWMSLGCSWWFCVNGLICLFWGSLVFIVMYPGDWCISVLHLARLWGKRNIGW